MPSEKTVVVDRLWDMLQAEGKGRTVVSMDDVAEAIQYCSVHFNVGLRTSNPANFMKDIIRSQNASDIWPERLARMGITGRQRVGLRRVLEFVPFSEGQTEAFPDQFTADDLISDRIESVSLSRTAKTLGRQDESWLIQTAVNLRVVERHFAVHSPTPVVEMTHLQTGVKLGGSEVDALFKAVLNLDNRDVDVLITCEAKQQNERILHYQIIEQIVAVNRSISSAGLSVELIVPIAMKAIAPAGCILIVEFAPWTPAQASVPENELMELVPVSRGLYQLMPPVKGIGFRPSSPSRRFGTTDMSR